MKEGGGSQVTKKEVQFCRALAGCGWLATHDGVLRWICSPTPSFKPIFHFPLGLRPMSPEGQIRSSQLRSQSFCLPPGGPEKECSCRSRSVPVMPLAEPHRVREYSQVRCLEKELGCPQGSPGKELPHRSSFMPCVPQQNTGLPPVPAPQQHHLLETRPFCSCPPLSALVCPTWPADPSPTNISIKAISTTYFYWALGVGGCHRERIIARNKKQEAICLRSLSKFP